MYAYYPGVEPIDVVEPALKNKPPSKTPGDGLGHTSSAFFEAYRQGKGQKIVPEIDL